MENSIFQVEKKLQNYVNVKFSQIPELTDTISEQLRRQGNHKGFDKGLLGKLVEKLAGLERSAKLTDCIDGELKIIPFLFRDGIAKPKETCAVLQFGSKYIDTFLSDTHCFYDSKFYKKLKQVCYVIIDETSANPADWSIVSLGIISENLEDCTDFYKKLNNGYNEYKDKQIELVKSGNQLSSIGMNCDYFEIRPKDTSPYHPVYSSLYNCIVADKGRGMFLKKDALCEIYRILSSRKQEKRGE